MVGIRAAYDMAASPRAAVVPGWEGRVTAPAASFFPPESAHTVLAGTRVAAISDNTLKIDPPHLRFGAAITFDYAVLATGLS